ncbi:MAG TPA: FHA domain-containing protein [Anaerolineales bacterium]|nr:FHA domain-containing protein [Anaerolineales bacterium]
MAKAEYHLTATTGPEAGKNYPLGESPLVIGREAACEITIDDKTISRRHAKINHLNGRYFIADLGSSNGTFINGNRLGSSPVPLAPGDQIQLGTAVTLVFEPLVSPEAPTRIGKRVNIHGAATVFDAESIDLPSSAPPELLVTVAGQTGKRYPLTKDRITLGRAADNDIVVDSKIVSRYHATLERVEGGYRFVPLPDATNLVYLDGYPLYDPQLLQNGNILRIGGADPGMMISMTYSIPDARPATIDALTIQFGERSVLRIGRDAGNDIVLDAPNVSRFHAQIERVGKRYRVSDLQSSNGTFVNNQRITAETWVKPGDTVKVGLYRFVLGLDQVAQYSDIAGLQVNALGLNKWVRKDLNILQNISLVFQPREFVVVVGQSGGGKSTLIDAIAGYRPATHGAVLVNGIDVYKDFDAVRDDIGYVPQRDIIHMELTVYQALDYAARLRMPADTTKEERHQRVMEVLEDLDLLHRKDVQISGLSGGQQKRVSIGVELLTKPGLFFLDEPTSGLDPGTETALMQLMRRLADQGRTIVLVTHATKNVMLADKVVFLARGGHMAWFGPPDEALSYFDQFRSEIERRTSPMEFDQIYAILEDTSKGNGADWAQRYQQHPAYLQYIVQPLQQQQYSDRLDTPSQIVKKPASQRSHKKISSLRQFFILSSRNIKILVRDRTGLVLMLLAAPLIGSLDLIIAPLMGRHLYDYWIGDMQKVSVTTFLFTIYAILVGGMSQMREFVKEADVYKRERLVNLRIVPYVASKIWVALLLALYQAMAYTVIHYIAFDMPGGTLDFVMIYISMVLATLSGMMLGLMASALAPQASAAPLIMILFLVPQIVLSGALAPLPSYASAPAATRWVFEGLIGITGPGSDLAADDCWQIEPELRDQMTLEDKENLGCNCMGKNIFVPGSCEFPGIGQFYDPALDSPAPQEPPPLREPPPEPEIPEPPSPPDDQSDQVAVAAYLTALQDYQAEVQGIQDQYRAEMDVYQAEAEVYKAEMVEYQSELAEWEIGRYSAINGAESVMEAMLEQFGWAYVNKEDQPVFYKRIFTTWGAQLILSGILIVMIMVLIKRKDAR